jgi:CHAT domain
VSAYAEFRLVVTPDPADRSRWQIAIDECPLPEFVGSQGSVVPTINRPELLTLRSREGWPNPAALRTIGTAVWQSIMTPGANAAFASSIAVAKEAGQRLRIVVVLQGDGDQDAAAGPAVRLSELPVEALHSDVRQFIATDLDTPISRSLQQRPDRDIERIVPPLRLLLAVAAPSDKPPAQVDDEIKAISDAVQALSSQRLLEVDVVKDATRAAVADRLRQKPYNVLHFIGHGGFEVIGQAKTPRAYLCFIRDDSTLSHPTDADTLLIMLRNTTVRLVVITACSSSAPTPPQAGVFDAGPLGTGAFDGVAQRLITGGSPVNAAVAMQFDLESKGAVAFSRSFYTHMLRPNTALDEAVTYARQALVTALEAGHRAWVTPTVYWRAKDGRIFDVDHSQVSLDDATLMRLRELDSLIGIHMTQVERIAAKPAEERAVLADFRDESSGEIERLSDERAQLVGECIRVYGKRVPEGDEVRLRLTLRTRVPGTFDLVALSVNYPPAALAFVGADGASAGAAAPATSSTEGAAQVVVANPGAGNQWAAGDYDLGFLRFNLVDGGPRPFINVTVTAPQVMRDGKPATFKTVDALVNVEDAP